VRLLPRLGAGRGDAAAADDIPASAPAAAAARAVPAVREAAADRPWVPDAAAARQAAAAPARQFQAPPAVPDACPAAGSDFPLVLAALPALAARAVERGPADEAALAAPDPSSDLRHAAAASAEAPALSAAKRPGESALPSVSAEQA